MVLRIFRELSNELSITVRDPATKVDNWLPHADDGDFKASPAFGEGDVKILIQQEVTESARFAYSRRSRASQTERSRA